MLIRRNAVIFSIIFILCLFSFCCDDFTTPEAQVKVTDWEQNYYSYFGGWSDLVKFWYEIENTGNINIDYYKIWFQARCFDGSEYKDWTNGIGLDIGRKINDYMFISVPHKKVESVSVVDYDLTSY